MEKKKTQYLRSEALVTSPLKISYVVSSTAMLNKQATLFLCPAPPPPTDIIFWRSVLRNDAPLLQSHFYYVDDARTLLCLVGRQS